MVELRFSAEASSDLLDIFAFSVERFVMALRRFASASAIFWKWGLSIPG